MANKTTFTPDEWTKLMESVMLSGMAVTAADPSGLFGVLKESMATGRTLLAAKSDPEANELVRAVANDLATSEGRQAVRNELKATLHGGDAGNVSRKSIAALHEVASLLDSKAPADAAGFKTWLQQIATGAAEAANEGGFMGFGGVRVSEAERATIGELASALGIASACTTAAGRSAPAKSAANEAAGNTAAGQPASGEFSTGQTPGKPSGPSQAGKA